MGRNRLRQDSRRNRICLRSAVNLGRSCLLVSFNLRRICLWEPAGLGRDGWLEWTFSTATKDVHLIETCADGLCPRSSCLLKRTGRVLHRLLRSSKHICVCLIATKVNEAFVIVFAQLRVIGRLRIVDMGGICLWIRIHARLRR